MIDFAAMQRMLYEGKADEVEAWTRQAIADSVPAGQILQEGLIAGMKVVGEDFKNNVIYVPHVLVAARAMKAGMAVSTCASHQASTANANRMLARIAADSAPISDQERPALRASRTASSSAVSMLPR